MCLVPADEELPLLRVCFRTSTSARSELAASASGRPMDSEQSWLFLRGALPKDVLPCLLP